MAELVDGGQVVLVVAGGGLGQLLLFCGVDQLVDRRVTSVEVAGMLCAMIMIAGSSAADTSDPIGVLILLVVLGAAAVCFGGRWAFNVRGAVESTLTRRRAALEVRGRRTGDLSLADTESLSPFFFRFLGSVIAVAGLAMVGLSLILVTG
ncbi:hypothetical protein ACFXDO_36650 [Streptomyces nigra]|uniref:hypothetical protein n=1 Tax=Streptomyces nigra TaxID=1827580 RepID=UPI00368FAC75